MELLLWRWSTTAQVASALLIAVFFVVLGRSVRRAELRAWVQAWLANLAALIVTSVFWFAPPSGRWGMGALIWGYFFFKTMFAAMLAVGAWRFIRPHARIHTAPIAVVVAAAAVAPAVIVTTVGGIGVVQSTIVAVVLGATAVSLLVFHVPASGWLAAGYLVRAGLGALEALAYGSQIVTASWLPADRVATLLATHSSFDTGAEWMIALACVLIVYRTIQAELSRSNSELVAAKRALQELVDHDPLTGLSNRRTLPAVLRASYDTGATILFFDLNDFKGINDTFGHEAGDDCLKRFGQALRASFRPSDHVIRYAGDEFVVIAQGVEPAQMADRIDTLRERLRFERVRGQQIAFSVGHAYMGVHGDSDAAMQAADEAMYRDKSRKPPRRRSILA